MEPVMVRFLHDNHLNTCKKASGSSRDLADIEEFEKIRKAGKKEIIPNS